MSSFDRHLNRMNYGLSIVQSIEFARVREVLKAKQWEFKSQGKGNRVHKASPINDEEIDTLWQSKQFGSSTPESILDTLWFFNTVHFGLRGSHEHRHMLWGDVTLKTDSTGHEYLQFEERQTKTRQGENPKDIREVTPKMFANREMPERCPIEVYKVYASKRPQDLSQISDPFYLATHTNQSSMKEGEQWFKRQPVGVNKLSNMMQRIASAAGIEGDKKFTNHSARKHLVQKLSENNVPANQIMQITGHRNIQSVNNYSHIDEKQHKNISKILSTPSSEMPGSSCTVMNMQQNNSLVQNTSACKSTSSSVSIYGGVHTLFAGNIHGGNFAINVHSNAATTTTSDNSTAIKRHRVLVDSDGE